MIKLKHIVLLLFVLMCSCTNIDFIYKQSQKLENPIYKKTSYQISGKEIPTMYSNIVKYFGNSPNPSYTLNINTREKTVRRSVQSNQAVSKVDYELQFNYSLKNHSKDCMVLEKKVITRFSYTPKSSGYNYGSDQSLERMYDLSTLQSLEQFTNEIYSKDLESCK